MTAWPWLLGSVLLASLGITGAAAQVVGPDEAVGPSGSVAQQTILSAQQRRAIYEEVARQRVRYGGPVVTALVGAPVPPSLTLYDVPDQPADVDQANEFGVRALKYAMVADDIVVVDPIAMRIVDVIHRGGVKP